MKNFEIVILVAFISINQFVLLARIDYLYDKIMERLNQKDGE